MAAGSPLAVATRTVRGLVSPALIAESQFLNQIASLRTSASWHGGCASHRRLAVTQIGSRRPGRPMEGADDCGPWFSIPRRPSRPAAITSEPVPSSQHLLDQCVRHLTKTRIERG
jgi:hypothetical protein